MGLGYYDPDGNPITMWQWANEFEWPRHIGDDKVGDVRISTVWLGLDHSFGMGPPLIFETMVFGGPHDQWMDRYHTKAQAIAGHDQVVAAIRLGHEPTRGGE